MPTMGYALQWPWSYLVPNYMKNVQIDSYDSFKCAFLLWIGIQVGKRTTGNGGDWGKKINPIFEIGGFNHATFIRGMAHGRKAIVTSSGFNRSYIFMMRQRNAAKTAPYPEEHHYYKSSSY